MKRIMSREAYTSGRVCQNSQDRNQEFITCIACVSVLRKKIPATLLYKGKLFDLQNTWVQQLEDQDNFFFSASSNG